MNSAKAKYAITKCIDQPISLHEKDTVIQFEVSTPEIVDCSGAYLKLYGPDPVNPVNVSNATQYVIMFGPDKCGSVKKVHFIFNHFQNGKISEKTMKIPPEPLFDNKTHVYTLVIKQDNSFVIKIDNKPVRFGSLLTDFYPPVNIREIPDPSDKKPSDWIDDEYVIDETAVKPDDWDEDEPEYIPDPSRKNPPKGWLLNEPRTIDDPQAHKPDDWDDDVLGEWEAPQISNPKCKNARGCGPYEAPLIVNEKYKGKWEPPRFRNPLYKGPWRPRMIQNPDYVEDLHPHNMQNVTAVGFELWAVTPGVGFRNIIISHDIDAVEKWTIKNYGFVDKKSEAEMKKIEEMDTPIPLSMDMMKKLGIKLSIFEEIVQFWKDFYQKDKAVAIAMFCAILFAPIVSYYIARRF